MSRIVTELENRHTTVEAFYKASDMWDYFDNISSPLKAMGAERLQAVSAQDLDVEGIGLIIDEWILPSGTHVFAGYEITEESTERTVEAFAARVLPGRASSLDRETDSGKGISSKSRQPKIRFGWILIALLIALLYSYFIWPTLYMYTNGDGGTLVRIHRLTGKTEVLDKWANWMGPPY